MSLVHYNLTVEVAADGGPLTASPSWTDVTASIRAADGVKLTRGRQSEQSTATPGSASFTISDWLGDDPAQMIGRRVRLTATTGRIRYDEPVDYDTSADWDGGPTPLWAGHVTDWTDSWDNAGVKTSLVNAAGILEVLARDPSPGLFYSAVSSTDPILWWPLNEPEGPTSARDVIGGNTANQSQIGTGGTFDLGAGPVFDENTWAAFTPASGANGKVLIADLVTPFRGDQDFTIACVCATTIKNYVSFGFYSEGGMQVLTILPAGTIGAAITYNGAYAIQSGTFDDGQPHLYVAAYDAGTGDLDLWVDGVASSSKSGPPAPIAGLWQRVYIGGHGVATAFDGNVGHAVAWQRVLTSAERDYLWEAASQTYGIAAGQLASDRFDLVTRAAAVPSALVARIGTSTATMTRQPIKDSPVTAALEAVELADQGLVGETSSGAVGMRCSSDRHSATPAVTLDARIEVLNDFRLRTNTSGLVNEFTATAELTGAQFTVIDQASVVSYGRRAKSAKVYLSTDLAVTELAGWLAYRDSTPSPRSDQIVVDMETLSRYGTYTAVLALDPGDTLEVTDLPDGATLTLEVIGLDDDIGSSQWRRTIRVAPSMAMLWTLDSSSLSILDATTRLHYL